MQNYKYETKGKILLQGAYMTAIKNLLVDRIITGIRAKYIDELDYKLSIKQYLPAFISVYSLSFT